MHYPTYKQSVILLLIWLLNTLVCALLILVPFFETTDGIGLGLTYTVSMILTVCVGFHNRNNWQLRFTSFPWPIVVVCFFVTIFSQIILEPLQNVLPESDTVNKLTQGMHAQPYVFFLMVVIAGPVLEEVLFRGIIFEGFIKNYKPIYAILASSFLFALVHGNLQQGLNAFVIGAVYAWVYWNTKSIWPCIILHVINNGMAFLASVNIDEADTDKTLRESLQDDTRYTSIYVLAALLLISCIWILKTWYYSPGFPKEEVTSDVPPEGASGETNV